MSNRNLRYFQVTNQQFLIAGLRFDMKNGKKNRMNIFIFQDFNITLQCENCLNYDSYDTDNLND
jgi:hypothetical protein